MAKARAVRKVTKKKVTKKRGGRRAGAGRPKGSKSVLPQGTAIYPEISGSHHRCSIRFLEWQDPENRPVQVLGDVPFTLATCT